MLLVIHAVDRIIHPKDVSTPEIGIAVMIVSIIVTLALVSFQSIVARKTGSLAVKADSLHYRTDILMNAMILLALLLAWFGFDEWDGIFALGVAFYILYSAWGIGKEAINALMDHALPEDSESAIRVKVEGHAQVHGLHELRTRQAGPTVFIQFHLELDDELPLCEAHRISEEVENSLREEYPHADILIHQDPQSVVAR